MQITKFIVGLILKVHDLSKNFKRQKNHVNFDKTSTRAKSDSKRAFLLFVSISWFFFTDNLVFSCYSLNESLQLVLIAQEIRKYKAILKVFERRTSDPKFQMMPLKFLVYKAPFKRILCPIILHGCTYVRPSNRLLWSIVQLFTKACFEIRALPQIITNFSHYPSLILRVKAVAKFKSWIGSLFRFRNSLRQICLG